MHDDQRYRLCAVPVELGAFMVIEDVLDGMDADGKEVRIDRHSQVCRGKLPRQRVIVCEHRVLNRCKRVVPLLIKYIPKRIIDTKLGENS